MKRRTYKNGMIDEHPVIFPNILRQGNVGQIRVPMDDTHTKIYFVRFYPTESGEIVENDEPPVEYLKSYKNPPDALHPFTRFRMDAVQAQDHMAWETQGPICDRTAGAADQLGPRRDSAARGNVSRDEKSATGSRSHGRCARSGEQSVHRYTSFGIHYNLAITIARLSPSTNSGGLRRYVASGQAPFISRFARICVR